MATFTTKAPYNIRCAYFTKQLVGEVRTLEKMCLEHVFES